MKELQEVRSDLDFEREKAWITDGVLDSFDIISIIVKLGAAFEVEIPVEEINEENFDDIESLEKLLIKLQANG